MGPEISDYRAGAGVAACAISAANMQTIFQNNLLEKCKEEPG